MVEPVTKENRVKRAPHLPAVAVHATLKRASKSAVFVRLKVMDEKGDTYYFDAACQPFDLLHPEECGEQPQETPSEPSDDFRSRITIERLKEMRRTQGDGGPVCTIRGNGVAVCCCCGARVTRYRQFIGYNLCDACLDASEPRSASTPTPPDALPKPVNHDLWRHMREARGLTLTQSEIDDILLLIPTVTSQAQSERLCEMEGLDETHDLSAGVICIPCWNELASRAAQPPEVDSRDSAAQVDQFAEAMKAKMHEKSMQGYGGWEEASAEHLARLLIEHVPKGDPVDIANFAMMLWHHKGGEEIRRACSPPLEVSINNELNYLRDALRDANATIERKDMALIELHRASQPPSEGPFVVADGGVTGENRFRTMKDGMSAWTLDLDEALQFSRRKDAEAFAAEDEDAWQIIPVPWEKDLRARLTKSEVKP